LIVLAGVEYDPVPTPPDFNREVRPILSDRCFRCHGPDAASRKRGLRLDNAEGATALLKSGLRAIVPGDVNASEMARRITSDEPDEMMPPPEMKHPLTEAEKQVLIKWIQSGAEYKPHWAFVPPIAAAVPEVKDKSWPRDPIDRFVLARLEAESLTYAPEADRATLLRRVSFALTGLPPTPEETEAFLNDQSKDAYEKQVDRLLASPRFGERMAADWLDVARYADTYGYQSDWDCRVWPWRDWLINAFNSNLPYNQFIRDQIAGDLIPSATRDQKIATAFNRLHRQTNEGGSIDEEFRQEYTSDRVHTFGTAFLGLTIECARCHDHKYDPIPQSDYYSLTAFFNAIDEAGTYPYSTPATPRPAMRLPTPEQSAKLAALQQAVDAAEANQTATLANRQLAFREWLTHPGDIAVPAAIKRYPLEGDIEGPNGMATALDGDTGPSFADVPVFRRCDPHSLVFWMRCAETKARATIIHTSTFTIESDEQGYQVMLKDGRLCWEIIHNWPGSAAAIQSTQPFPLNQWVQVAVAYDGSSRAAGLHIYLNGKPVSTEVTHDHLDGPATVRSFQVGFRDRDLGFKGGAVADLQVFDRELSAIEASDLHQPGELKDMIANKGNNTTNVDLAEFYQRAIDPDCLAAAKSLRDTRAAYQDLVESIPELMVMEESRQPRASFVLSRGQYDQPDKTRPVHPDRAIEAVLKFDPSWPHNRLGLVNWTTDPQNPLTARVAVNRLWSLCFGRGLVPTLENLGQQGEAPTHPEVLDTLAADFVKNGWDVKATLKRIVLSTTFRQSSDLPSTDATSDPQNTKLARGPSLRLPAEALRDQALAASGLLVEKLGGPSVKPWQPPGLYEDAGATGAYTPDTGDNAHRRSLYTFRKRTSPTPNMQAFDAGSGEKCLARRLPTNTPQQALVLMNDPVFVECARALALRATSEAEANPTAQITRAFRLLTSRPPRPGELTPLLALYEEQSADFSEDQPAAKSVNGSESPDPHTAALTLVCSTILASDAAVTSR